MKRALFSIAIMIGGSVPCLSQEMPNDTVSQLSASRIIIHAKHLKNKDSKVKGGYYYIQSFDEKDKSLGSSGLIMTYDDKKRDVIIESEKSDEIQVSYIKDFKK